ncbi:hypothetical protein [Cytobacillus oceanisediminis]|nr:hypothetical protein [Cytobacillus oceanisediminis]
MSCLNNGQLRTKPGVIAVVLSEPGPTSYKSGVIAVDLSEPGCTSD